MKYIYGPVKSRRLGRSLGVSLTPYKTCSFDCVYCQLGKTSALTSSRKECLGIYDIVNELVSWVKNNPGEEKELDYITLSGSGEPTLNSKIGELIGQIKKISSVKVAVITNSSFLSDKDVRKSISGADLIVPSLDAVTDDVFRLIDRPHPDIKIKDVIEGLINLRKEYKGPIWLEIMLVKGINDSPDYIRKIKEVIDKINPDKIQINSPVRTTTEKEILPPDENVLREIKEILGSNAEVV